jgi:hypothetical protein
MLMVNREKVPMAVLIPDPPECIVFQCTGEAKGSVSMCWACSKVLHTIYNIRPGSVSRNARYVLPESLQQCLVQKKLEKPIEDPLVEEAKRVLKQKLLKKGDYHYELMLHTLICLQKTSSHGLRHDDMFYAIGISIAWYGGRRTYYIVRGMGGVGRGVKNGIKNDSSRCNTYLPAYESLKKRIPSVDPTLTVAAMCRVQIQKLLRGYKGRTYRDESGQEWVVGILSSDEISIRAGVQRLKNGDQIMGLIPHEGSVTGCIPVAGIAEYRKKFTDKEIEDLLAKNALTTLFVDIHGQAFTVINQLPTIKATGEEHMNMYRILIGELKNFFVKILATFTDGFSGSKYLVDNGPKSTYHPRISPLIICTVLDGAHQGYDPGHTVKNSRNFSKDRVIKSKLCPTGFSFRDLRAVWSGDSVHAARLRPLITETELNPKDKMAIEPVLNLFEAVDVIDEVGSAMKAEGNENGVKLMGLAEYLRHLRTWYRILNDYEEYQKFSVDQKLAMLEAVVLYFEEIHKLFPHNSASLDNTRQYRATYETLCYVSSEYRKMFGEDLPKFGHLCTIGNENLFSSVW